MADLDPRTRRPQRHDGRHAQQKSEEDARSRLLSYILQGYKAYSLWSC